MTRKSRTTARVPTTAPSAIETLTVIAEEMERSGGYGIEGFSKTFANDPYRAFEWIGQTVTDAARLHVGKQVLTFLRERTIDDDQFVNSLLKHMRREVLNHAHFPTRSTNPVTNEASLALTSARAEFLDRYDRARDQLGESRGNTDQSPAVARQP